MGTPPPRHPPALGDLPYTCPHPTAPEINAESPPGDLQLLVYPLLLKNHPAQEEVSHQNQHGLQGEPAGPGSFWPAPFFGACLWG